MSSMVLTEDVLTFNLKHSDEPNPILSCKGCVGVSNVRSNIGPFMPHLQRFHKIFLIQQNNAYSTYKN